MSRKQRSFNSPAPSYLKQKSDKRKRMCPICQKVFIRPDTEKGWRDHCGHVNACVKKRERTS